MLKQDKLDILVFIEMNFLVKFPENQSKIELILIDLKITQTKTYIFLDLGCLQ
jgi:hypothetical protein